MVAAMNESTVGNHTTAEIHWNHTARNAHFVPKASLDHI